MQVISVSCSIGYTGRKEVALWNTWLDHASFNAEIYEFTETEEETGKSYVECELKKIAAATFFDDNGDAIKWCYDNMNKVKLLN